MKCIKVCPLAFLIGRLLGNNVTSQVCLQCKQMQSRECYIEQNVFEKSVKPAFCCTCTVPQVYLTQLYTRRYRRCSKWSSRAQIPKGFRVQARRIEYKEEAIGFPYTLL